MKKGLFIVCVAVLFAVYLVKLLSPTSITWHEHAKVVEKVTTQLRDGQGIARRILVLRFPNGEVEEREVSSTTYANCDEGGVYYFRRDSSDWSKLDFSIGLLK